MSSIVKIRSAILAGSGNSQKTHIAKLFPKMMRELILFINFLGKWSDFLICKLSDKLPELLEFR